MPGSIRLGYACINQTLSELEKLVTTRTCRRKTLKEKGLTHIGELFKRNINNVQRILKWNVENKIFIYRMSSDMAPRCSEYDVEDIPNWKELVKLMNDTGQYAIDNGIRLSFHPGAYTVLAGTNSKTIRKSIKELEAHGKIMDCLLQPRSRMAKINIHVGGTYGNMAAAADRWINNSRLLSDAVLSRITLENDDRGNLYSTRDLYNLIYSRTGIPIVFDYHHHHACTGGDESSTALHLAASTWDCKPCTHYSESAQSEWKEESGDRQPMFRAHSKMVKNKINPHGLDIDVVIEAKKKEQALLNYRSIHG